MRRFLIVGCGGSGGRTVRLLIDQLRADLRTKGVTSLPAAWQFVHVDVPVDPDKGPSPLGSIRDLGGQYLSFSSPTNSYLATANAVESQLVSKGGNFAPVMGWAPRDRKKANGIPVTSGAGQYRAVGRMLTLPRLAELRETLVRAQARMVADDAWGELGVDSGNEIIPIVIGSMAGGSGSSMFLDVCRVLASVAGVKPQNVGCFLYTADVFAELSEEQRANVEGNAMAALPEIIAAIGRLSEPFDRSTYESLGLPFSPGAPPFARIFPIGRQIGGSGAYFGDGSSDGVYRGIARAIAGTMSSEEASHQYVAYMLGNPTPLHWATDRFGWQVDRTALPFGSLGFASLSLGRDRYLDYAAQRLSRSASDHLFEGHLNPTSQLPGNDQLRMLLDNQWAASLHGLGLPQPGQHPGEWFQTVAYPRPQWESSAREAAQPAVGMMANSGSAPAAQWVATVSSTVAGLHDPVRFQLQQAAYAWSEQWAGLLEAAAKQEFLRVTSEFGLPYARELMTRTRQHLDAVISELANAGLQADAANPVALDPLVGRQAEELGKRTVDFSHPLGQLTAQSLQNSMETTLRFEGAKLGAGVLRAYVNDVLQGLEKAANDALRLLEVERAQSSGGAGLAQLNTAVYADWPDESDRVPDRFDHAENEVLLTTSRDFPAQFRSDVVASAGAGYNYLQGISKLRAEAISGVWQTTGSKVSHEVLAQEAHWRPRVLPRSSDGSPTPESKPRYALDLRCVDLLERSTRRLAAGGDVFAAFAETSISDYLDDPAITPIDRQQRQASFAGKLVDTMHKARPVVGIDVDMARQLHGADIRYIYLFSEIPIDSHHPVAQQVVDRLSSDPELDYNSAENFKRALAGAISGAGKVSVYGSYQKVSPLCYRSLLEPINSRWAKAPESMQRDLWAWKRSRPLSAALAMSKEEAETIVAGWYLGRLIGLVRQNDYGAAQVLSKRGWLDFGRQLSSQETAVRTPHDVLAGILMSHAWAFVKCVGDVELAALEPYEALRVLVDGADSNERSLPDANLNGTKLLRAAFYGRDLDLGGVRLAGDALSPLLTQIPAGASPAETAKARADAVIKWADSLKAKFATEWGALRPDGRADDVAIANYRLEIDADSMRELSLFAELGPLALPALDRLKRLAEAASIDEGATSGADVWV